MGRLLADPRRVEAGVAHLGVDLPLLEDVGEGALPRRLLHRFTSLNELADICDGTSWSKGRDYFGKPLHIGKTTWIDVLFTCQFGLDATPETSARIVELTAERYGAAFEHLVVLVPSFLTRAWCLAELAVTASTAA